MPNSTGKDPFAFYFGSLIIPITINLHVVMKSTQPFPGVNYYLNNKSTKSAYNHT